MRNSHAATIKLHRRCDVSVVLDVPVEINEFVGAAVMVARALVT